MPDILLKELRAELAALKGENESLKRDAERLDFILRKQLIVIQDCDDKYCTYNAQSGKRGPEMDSEAEAIDASAGVRLERRVSRIPTNMAQLEYLNMRELNEHKINPGNDTLTITVLDEPGHGGANHAYDIEGGEAAPTHLRFQNGPISADGNGVNGITHEALLAVLCDRLRGFQKGPYACKANACALTHLEEAQHWLQQRTIERMRRGVEGTHTV